MKEPMKGMVQDKSYDAPFRSERQPRCRRERPDKDAGHKAHLRANQHIFPELSGCGLRAVQQNSGRLLVAQSPCLPAHIVNFEQPEDHIDQGYQAEAQRVVEHAVDLPCSADVRVTRRASFSVPKAGLFPPMVPSAVASRRSALRHLALILLGQVGFSTATMGNLRGLRLSLALVYRPARRSLALAKCEPDVAKASHHEPYERDDDQAVDNQQQYPGDLTACMRHVKDVWPC
jgi:hypothetical protein